MTEHRAKIGPCFVDSCKNAAVRRASVPRSLRAARDPEMIDVCTKHARTAGRRRTSGIRFREWFRSLKHALTNADIERILELYDPEKATHGEGPSLEEIAAEYGVHRMTIHRLTIRGGYSAREDYPEY